MDAQKPPAIVRPASPSDQSRQSEQKAMDKIDPLLKDDVTRHPERQFSVVVNFERVPDEKALDKLGLRSVPPNEAIGHLTRSQIEALARQDNVRSIRSRPQPRAF